MMRKKTRNIKQKKTVNIFSCMYNFFMGGIRIYGFIENFHRPKSTFPNIVGFCLCRVLQFFPIKFCTNEINYEFFTMYSLEMAFLSISPFIRIHSPCATHTHTHTIVWTHFKYFCQRVFSSLCLDLIIVIYYYIYHYVTKMVIVLVGWEAIKHLYQY